MTAGDGDERLVLGPHVFVADLDAPALDPEDRHHLARVLRVRDGDPISVSDGRGRWRPCRFGSELSVEGPVRSDPAPTPSLTIGFALVKGARPELVVQKLTEIGIDRIVPFVADRSVVRWDPDKADRNVERWRKVAREAAMQSRRTWLPEVDEVVPFASVVEAAAGGVALADRAGRPPSLRCGIVLIGPEGGWSPEERARVPESMRFGSHVLRAETAAIATASVLVALRGGLVQGQ